MPLFLVTSLIDEGMYENNFQLLEAESKLAVAQHMLDHPEQWHNYLDSAYPSNWQDRTFNVELKKYISEHRNDESAFRAALQVLINRSDSSTQQPYPFSLTNPESEVEALLRERINYNK